MPVVLFLLRDWNADGVSQYSANLFHSQPNIWDFTNKEEQHIFYHSLATQGSPDFGTEVLQTINCLMPKSPPGVILQY